MALNFVVLLGVVTRICIEIYRCSNPTLPLSAYDFFVLLRTMYRGQRLANMLLEKDASDDVLINENRNYWYQVNLDAIPSAEIRSTFHRSAYDNETESFLDASLSTSNSVCLQVS